MKKACIVKIANTSDKAQPVSVTFNGLKKSDKLVEGKCITLQSADLDKDNTVEHPNVITPKESAATVEGNVLNVRDGRRRLSCFISLLKQVISKR